MATISWRLHHLVQIGHKHKIGLMPGSRKRFGQAGLCPPCQLVHLDRQASHLPCPQCFKLVEQAQAQIKSCLEAASSTTEPRPQGSSIVAETSVRCQQFVDSQTWHTIETCVQLRRGQGNGSGMRMICDEASKLVRHPTLPAMQMGAHARRIVIARVTLTPAKPGMLLTTAVSEVRPGSADSRQRVDTRPATPVRSSVLSHCTGGAPLPLAPGPDTSFTARPTSGTLGASASRTNTDTDNTEPAAQMVFLFGPRIIDASIERFAQGFASRYS